MKSESWLAFFAAIFIGASIVMGMIAFGLELLS